jgi:hypothetical protein
VTELDVIKQKIRKYLNEYADDLASGVATDYPHYRYLTGVVHGLALIEREIIDLQKSSQEED